MKMTCHFRNTGDLIDLKGEVNVILIIKKMLNRASDLSDSWQTLIALDKLVCVVYHLTALL